MGGEGAEEHRIGHGEASGVFVQHFGHPNDVAAPGPHRNAEDGCRLITGLGIDFTVEARIEIRIVNDRGLAAVKYCAGDPALAIKANFFDERALGNARK